MLIIDMLNDDLVHESLVRNDDFCRAMLRNSGLYVVMRCLSICLSVCPLVCRVHEFCQNEQTYLHFFHHQIAKPF